MKIKQRCLKPALYLEATRGQRLQLQKRRKKKKRLAILYKSIGNQLSNLTSGNNCLLILWTRSLLFGPFLNMCQTGGLYAVH